MSDIKVSHPGTAPASQLSLLTISLLSLIQGILERLAAGPVIGDGGFVFELEKRGYVKAGPWTPEAAVEQPEAVKQLHREFLRAGADVMQAFTFYASEDKLEDRGNKAGARLGVEAINRHRLVHFTVEGRDRARGVADASSLMPNPLLGTFRAFRCVFMA